MVYRFLKTVHKAICFCRIRANILTLLCNFGSDVHMGLQQPTSEDLQSLTTESDNSC